MVEVVKRQLWFYEIKNDRLRKCFFQFYFCHFYIFAQYHKWHPIDGGGRDAVKYRDGQTKGIRQRSHERTSGSELLSDS